MFNAKGFHHLLYDGRGELRPIEERMRRLRLVRYASSVISDSESISWSSNEKRFRYIVFRRRTAKEGDVAIFVRVILKESSPGNYSYYSVMDERI